VTATLLQDIQTAADLHDECEPAAAVVGSLPQNIIGLSLSAAWRPASDKGQRFSMIAACT